MIPPVNKLYATALLLLNLIACNSKPQQATQSGMDMPGMDMSHMHQAMTSAAATQFSQTMRRLWGEEVVLARLHAIGSGDRQLVTERLMKKQDEIGDAIAPYDGTATGAKLADLLKQRAAMTADDQRARENASAIAALLDQPELADLLNKLMGIDRKDLDASFSQAMMVADAIGNRIIAKFPDRF